MLNIWGLRISQAQLTSLIRVFGGRVLDDDTAYMVNSVSEIRVVVGKPQTKLPKSKKLQRLLGCRKAVCISLEDVGKLVFPEVPPTRLQPFIDVMNDST